MVYAPNPLTHNALSDRAALWCPADGTYCSPGDPCACCEPLDLATGGIVKGPSLPGDDSVPVLLESGYVIPGSDAAARWLSGNPEFVKSVLSVGDVVTTSPADNVPGPEVTPEHPDVQLPVQPEPDYNAPVAPEPGVNTPVTPQAEVKLVVDSDKGVSGEKNG
jgi:hypothetical protein